MKQNNILFLFCLLGPLMGFSQMQDTLRIGVHPDPPFIIADQEGGYSGLCVDLWEEVADKLAYPYQYVEYADEIGMLRALDFRELDATINPMTVSSIRLRMFEVSQPFFISSVGIATTTGSRSQFQLFLRNFFSLDFLKITLLLLFIIFCFGTLLWIVERRHNRLQFRPGFIGLLDGLWWSAVTMTTVGYGDKAPKTSLGKSIAIIWMFTAVIIISGFTATIASTLTVSSLAVTIENLQDLSIVKSLGSVRASGSEDFLIAHDIQPHQSFETPLEGLKALARQDLEAMVYDKTVLRYLTSEHQLEGNTQILPVTFNKQYRSFLFPKNSPYYNEINPVLVNRIHQADWGAVLRKYNLEEVE